MAGGNHLVERDRDADGNPSNGLEERTFVLQDGQGNISAITDASGNVLEYYTYDGLGNVTVHDANWVLQSPMTAPPQGNNAIGEVTMGTGYDWSYFQHSEHYDQLLGVYETGNGMYNPKLDRMLTPNPSVFAVGGNAYNPHPEDYEVPALDSAIAYAGSYVLGGPFLGGTIGDEVTSPGFMDGAIAALPYLQTAANVASFIPGINEFAIPLAITLNAAGEYAGGGSIPQVMEGVALQAAGVLVGYGFGNLTAEESVALQESFGVGAESEAAETAAETFEVRAITRSTLGTGTVVEGPLATNIPFNGLSGGAQRLVRQFIEDSGSAIGVGSGIPVQDVAQASQFLNREIAILQDSEGNLIARVGNIGNVYAEPGEQFLLHTHPVIQSVDFHFLTDIQNASSNIEAVVDWGGNMTYFNNSGIITNPTVSPINQLGYVVGWR